MGKDIGRRSVKNSFRDPRDQLRAFAPFLITVVSGAMVVMCIEWDIMNFAHGHIDMATASPEAREMMQALERRLLVQTCLGIFAMALIGYFVSVFYTHRIFGPMISVKKFIQRMIAGDHSGELKLREHDEFKDLADSLNELNRQLRDRK